MSSSKGLHSYELIRHCLPSHLAPQFMTGKYKDQFNAMDNSTYQAAAYFFFREKKLGKKSLANTMTAAASAATPGGVQGGKKAALPDVSKVVLEDDRVFLTPAEVRKGLLDVRREYACTDTELSKKCGAPNGNAVCRFMNMGGEFGGEKQDMYFLGARFLEMLRVHLGKPKSKMRLALEKETRPDEQPFLGINLEGKNFKVSHSCATGSALARHWRCVCKCAIT